LKVAGLPGEAGKLHPGNPEGAAGQNPDVKEQPRTPRGKPHRHRQNSVRDTVDRQQANPKPTLLN